MPSFNLIVQNLENGSFQIRKMVSHLPTVQIGFLCGAKPINLGEIPLPKNNGGANDKTFSNFV